MRVQTLAVLFISFVLGTSATLLVNNYQQDKNVCSTPASELTQAEEERCQDNSYVQRYN